MSQRRQFPKRTVERVRSRIKHSIGTSVGTDVLHTCSESETLIRTIIDLYYLNDGGTAGNTYDCGLQIELAPAGISIDSPAVSGEDLDQALPKTTIWEHNITGVSGMERPIPIFRDLKSQRKLKKTDQIRLETIGEVSSQGELVGHITQFFKD